MTNKESVPVVWIEQTGPITKGPVPWSKTPGFVAPIRYTLGDGTVQESSEMASKKRDLVEKLDAMPGRPRHPKFAEFRDGALVTYSTTFWIGPGSDTTGRTAEWLAACEAFEATRKSH